MRVSIVTISFNQREFLQRTMASVLEQDYPDIQYIVADPGSTDGSRELIEAMGDKVIRVFEKDQGPADGLNKGFALADGQIYAYLNSDDILYPGAVRKAVEYLRAHPDVAAVSGHAEIIDAQDRILRRSYSMPFNLVRYAYGACIVNQPSTFFRAEAFHRAGGFNMANRSNWDGELWVDMARSGSRFAVLNEVLSGYRVHGDSITGSAKLHQTICEYQRRIFQKIMGRPQNSVDRLLSLFYRVWRFAEDPRTVCERLFRGPIYGRTA